MQVLVADRRLRLQGRPPLLADPTLVWGVGVTVPMTAGRIIPGYRTVLMGNRLALHTVCVLDLLCSLVAGLMLAPQAVPFPQLRREDGWLLYLAAGGPFTLRGARGTVTNERVVELRAARDGNRTGPLDSYNFLASQLPQDTRVLYHRWDFSYNV